jgi:trk system potassium uptake protein TrkA
VTLPHDTPLAGRPVSSLRLPTDSALVVILRGGRVIVPQSDDALEPGDELLFVATSAVEEDIRAALGY